VSSHAVAFVRLSQPVYFSGYNGVNPNSNPICGMKVTANCGVFQQSIPAIITDTLVILDKGKSTTVTITDRCEGCALTDLDFSPSAFQDLADFSVGRLSGMTWVWD